MSKTDEISKLKDEKSEIRTHFNVLVSQTFPHVQTRGGLHNTLHGWNNRPAAEVMKEIQADPTNNPLHAFRQVVRLAFPEVDLMRKKGEHRSPDGHVRDIVENRPVGEILAEIKDNLEKAKFAKMTKDEKIQYLFDRMNEK